MNPPPIPAARKKTAFPSWKRPPTSGSTAATSASATPPNASTRYINDDMARYVARKIITHVLRISNEPKVLVKGVTFKENVSDIRNSRIVDTVKELLAFNIHVDVEDPYAMEEEVHEEYGLHLSRKVSHDYDAVIITVPHAQYKDLDDAYFTSITREGALVADLKGTYKNKIANRKY